EDINFLCGDCRRCLEQTCCPQLMACQNDPGCVDCVAQVPDAGPCGHEPEGYLLQCSLKCEPCYRSGDPHPGCFLDGGPDSNGTGGAGKKP
ncbi:MAG: hypothetical protein ABI193_02535, partial [Minicystis sp.]